MRKFSQRLKELRQEKGLSAMALGKATGLSDAAILRWENDRADPLGENIIKLAKFFDVTTDYLLGLTDY
ncbi:MAG: helix-turn-helix transcriptional regulator [Firmicutes bacterium]|nr:helix-turn-helix transcriptional regulator [Bacillota bacterium]